MKPIEAWGALKQNKMALAGLFVIAALVVLALIGPWIAPYNPLIPDPIHRLQTPSWAHPFGTDSLGRDIVSRIIYGSRISIIIGLIAVSRMRWLRGLVRMKRTISATSSAVIIPGRTSGVRP